MDALAKGEMLILSAQDIQRFGIMKLLWISIDRDQKGEHQLAFADQIAVHENILTRPALIRETHRCCVAQQFLDRRDDQSRITLYHLQLLRMLQQCQRAIADQIHCCLMPGNKEEPDHREQLGLAEYIFVLLYSYQAADEIVAGMGTLL